MVHKLDGISHGNAFGLGIDIVHHHVIRRVEEPSLVPNKAIADRIECVGLDSVNNLQAR